MPSLIDRTPFDVVTALAPSPHARFSRFFANIKSDLGFATYVPDCDTTACSFSAATQFGSKDPILDQPLIDFYAGYQIGRGNNHEMLTVPINDNIEFDGGIVTWIENRAGDRPYGNDLDPTLNLDVLELSFRNCERWQIVDSPQRLVTIHKIIHFQRRLAETGAFAEPRSHIYYLPELYCAYFGRCYAALQALPRAQQDALDPDGSFELIRRHVIAYVRDDLLAAEINAFDAALALLALAKLGAEPRSFTPALSCIARSFGEGGFGRPYKAYEWNKMKTPTRILVGGAVRAVGAGARPRGDEDRGRLRLSALLFSAGRRSIHKRPNAIALPEERSGFGDHQIALGKTFADLRLAFGKVTDHDLPGLDAVIADHSNDGSVLAIQHRGERDCDIAALRDDDLPAAERADAQPRVAADENVDLAELRAAVDGRGD